MKRYITLRYDPVKPETSVSIDERPVCGTDIYGFLYPVRNYPLQTWLEKSGSWKGLKRQIEDLVLGDEAEIKFIGRKTDFDDLKAVFEGSEGITVTYSPWDPIPHNKEKLEKAERLWKGLKESPYTDLADSTLFDKDEKEKSERWLVKISSPKDLTADMPDGCCCIIEDVFIEGGFLDSLESLSELERLTASMCRSADMICCVIEDSGRFNEYSRYARECGMGYRFVNGGAAKKAAKVELYQKYGEPFALRQKLLGYRKAVSHLKMNYYDNYDSLNSRYNELLQSRRKKHIPIASVEAGENTEEKELGEKLNWIKRTEKKFKELYNTVMACNDIG